MIKLYLFDIEGTITDINFVHKILFPYAFNKMEHFVLHHQTHPVVAAAVQRTRETVLEERGINIGLYTVIETLKNWIIIDRKHPALKDIQGLIWDQGYAQGEFKGHLYPDVKPFFSKILEQGSRIGIYSSGSVHAQKLILGYSVEGDLTPMISWFFDTRIGAKKEKNSYTKITEETKILPHEIHFFSDVPGELEAAQSAGMEVTQLLRPGTLSSAYKGIQHFYDFNFA